MTRFLTLLVTALVLGCGSPSVEVPRMDLPVPTEMQGMALPTASDDVVASGPGWMEVRTDAMAADPLLQSWSDELQRHGWLTDPQGIDPHERAFHKADGSTASLKVWHEMRAWHVSLRVNPG